MRRVRVLVLMLAAAAVAGCGEKDPNKNLKPVDPNAARPTKVVEGNTKSGPADQGAPIPR